MNESLQGWRLALALLIPALIIGAAGYIAYGALAGDDQDVATGSEQDNPTATEVPVTEPVERSLVSNPTPAAATAPTALIIPTAEPVATAPTAEAVPDPTAEPPAPTTTAPAPAPAATSAPAGPAPTATPDPSVLAVACGGAFPSTIEAGSGFGPLSADLTPAESAVSFRFTWQLGNSNFVTNPNSGTISYAEPGTYTVSVTGTNTTNDQTVSATCGTVTVTEAIAPFRVVCSVESVVTTIRLAEAKPPNEMRVTTSWTPVDAKLNLTYEFDTLDELIIVPEASSGNRQANAFGFADSEFSIFWRDPGSGETGLLSCPAYPGETTAEPTPTLVAGADLDEDGIEDSVDNCPALANDDQKNTDGDAQGNACDDDDDNDGWLDTVDNCPFTASVIQSDSDEDGIGDPCDQVSIPTATVTSDA